MNLDYKVGEVELAYKPTTRKRSKVASSADAYKILLPTYKEGTIDYKEYFKVLFLNQASQVLGYTFNFRRRYNRDKRRCQIDTASCATY